MPEPAYDPLGHDPATFWGFTDCGIEFGYRHATVRIAAHLDRVTSVRLADRIRGRLEASAGSHAS